MVIRPFRGLPRWSRTPGASNRFVWSGCVGAAQWRTRRFHLLRRRNTRTGPRTSAAASFVRHTASFTPPVRLFGLAGSCFFRRERAHAPRTAGNTPAGRGEAGRKQNRASPPAGATRRPSASRGDACRRGPGRALREGAVEALAASGGRSPRPPGKRKLGRQSAARRCPVRLRRRSGFAPAPRRHSRRNGEGRRSVRLVLGRGVSSRAARFSRRPARRSCALGRDGG